MYDGIYGNPFACKMGVQLFLPQKQNSTTLGNLHAKIASFRNTMNFGGKKLRVEISAFSIRQSFVHAHVPRLTCANLLSPHIFTIIQNHLQGVKFRNKTLQS